MAASRQQVLVMRHMGLILGFVGLAIVVGFFAWAFYATRDLGSWTGGSTAIAIMIAVGALGAGALTAALMWLAFYSSRKGYDDAAHQKWRGPEDRGTD